MTGHDDMNEREVAEMSSTDELIVLAALGELTDDDERRLEELAAVDASLAAEFDAVLDTAAQVQLPFGESVSPELRSSVLDAIATVDQVDALVAIDQVEALVAIDQLDDAVDSETPPAAPVRAIGSLVDRNDPDIERIETLDDALASTEARRRRSDLIDDEVVDLAAARSRRRRVATLLSTAAAVLALVAVGVVVRQVADSDDVIAAVVEADDAVVRSFDGSLSGDLRAVYSASERALVVDGAGFDPLDEASVLQLWLVSDVAVVPVGTFRPGDDGEVSVRFDDVDPSDVVLGVTQEPEGGSETPTLPVLATA